MSEKTSEPPKKRAKIIRRWLLPEPVIHVSVPVSEPVSVPVSEPASVPVSEPASVPVSEPVSEPVKKEEKEHYDLQPPIKTRYRRLQVAQKCAWCGKYLWAGEEIGIYDGPDDEYTDWMVHDSCNLVPKVLADDFDTRHKRYDFA